MRFTRHKLTQNLVGFPVYFQTFLIFVQRSNYHWSCFRSMRKTLHHKFKNKYKMPQNVIECWLKCKNRYWIWCMRKCSFFRANVSSLRIIFLKQAKGYQYIFFKKNIFVTINQLKKWHFMCLSLAYPRDSTLGNPGKYLWELNKLGSPPLGSVIFRPKLFKSWIVLSTG